MYIHAFSTFSFDILGRGTDQTSNFLLLTYAADGYLSALSSVELTEAMGGLSFSTIILLTGGAGLFLCSEPGEILKYWLHYIFH